LDLVVVDADRADLAVFDSEDSDEGKVQLLSGCGNLNTVRASPSTRVGSGIPRLLHNMITVRLGNNGEITNIVNDKGGAADGKARPRLTAYP